MRIPALSRCAPVRCASAALVLAAALGGASPARAAGAGGPGHIVGLRAHADGSATVVEVVADQPLSFTTLRLLDPVRVVLDFADAELSSIPPEIVVEDGTVRRIAAAAAGSRTARVVIELVAEAEFDVHAQGPRLEVRIGRSAPPTAARDPDRTSPSPSAADPGHAALAPADAAPAALAEAAPPAALPPGAISWVEAPPESSEPAAPSPAPAVPPPAAPSPAPAVPPIALPAAPAPAEVAAAPTPSPAQVDASPRPAPVPVAAVPVAAAPVPAVPVAAAPVAAAARPDARPSPRAAAGSGGAAQSAAAEPIAPVAPAFARRQGRRAAISGIGFRPQGQGVVLVRSDRQIEYSVTRGDRAVLLHFDSATIPVANNRLPLDTSFFGGPVERIVPVAAAGGTDVRIELREPLDFRVQQTEGLLTVTFTR